MRDILSVGPCKNEDEGVKEKAKQEFQLKIETYDKNYVLAAESDQDRMMWVGTLRSRPGMRHDININVNTRWVRGYNTRLEQYCVLQNTCIV